MGEVRYHTKISEDVPFSPEEEVAKNAEEAAILAAKPMDDWKVELRESDRGGMPRYVEDIIDSMDSAQLSRLPQTMKDRHTAKKALRARKPQE